MDFQEVFERIGFDGKMALINAINFLVFLFILNKFVFGKVGKIVRERELKISEGLANAEQADTKMQEIDAKFKEIIAKAEKEANEIVLKYQEEGNNQKSVIISEAREEAEKLKAEAQKSIEAEKQQMIDDLKVEMADLAISATEKIIEEKLDAKKDKKIVEEYLATVK